MASGSAGSSVVPPADEQLEASVAMNNEDSADGFLNSGRTGRRNALPDILDEQFTATTTADLPHELDKLSCSGKIEDFNCTRYWPTTRSEDAEKITDKVSWWIPLKTSPISQKVTAIAIFARITYINKLK